ncbi:MAG TPA: ribonuclease E/G, partial [Bacteroidaceae bacterium]|nr:ribonuclease E/G [Bacteroidaceae bacterium]
RFIMHVHPYVYAYINSGVLSLKTKWRLKYGTGIKIIPDQSLSFLTYSIKGSDGQEIDMKEERELI